MHHHKMRKVTKNDFYAAIGPQDVIARPGRDECIWETRGRQIVGRSTPGYMCRDAEGNYTDHKEYFLIGGAA